jgi:hypothetical protein
MKAIAGSLLLAVLFLAILICQPPPAHACAAAYPRGKSVRIATESALIVWDDKTKTQHFIRRASFQSDVPYFGFLVPTPTPPDLAEVDDKVFQSLEDWTKPEVKTETRYEWPSIGCAGSATKMAKGGVEVLAERELGRYRAAILKASEPEALLEWLEKHDYDARPQLKDWLKPYTDKGWIITAFQIKKKDEQAPGLSTSAVRMSFKAKRPFFPYREPAEPPVGARADYPRRLLRLFVISGQQMEGTLDNGKTAWPGKAVWANPLQDEQHEALTKLLDSKQVPVREGAWLTVFDDSSSPRPGVADLYFASSEDQSTLKRPPIIHYETVYIPACEVACILIVVMPIVLLVVLWRLWRRRTVA